jgi:hypothetical protein
MDSRVLAERLSVRHSSGVSLASAAMIGLALCAFIPHASSQTATGTPFERSDAAPEDLRREFNRRLANCRNGDRASRLELAEWSAQHGLIDQADEIYRQLLEADPRDEQAYQRLCELAEPRTLAPDSDCHAKARRLLGKQFVEYQSRRYIVLSDAEPSLARSQLSLLERAHHQFHRFATSVGLRPLPLRHKLVCVLFDSEAEYRAFGERNDDVRDDRITGYYSPRHDWIVFFDTRAWPQIVEARARIEAMKTEIRELGERARQAAGAGRASEAGALRNSVQQSQRNLEEYARRVDQITARESVATVVHEATHQLLFHTGVQSRRVRYPLWICEGLATCFETDLPHQAFGPDREYAPRRQRFLELLKADQLLPLRELLAIDQARNQRTTDAVYQQGYALVRWMYRTRRNELCQYLTSLAAEPARDLTAQRHVELFEQTFGNAEAIERAWLRFERAAAPTP